MHISEICLNDYVQDLNTKKETKILFGEVLTPFSLINQMLNMVDESVFKNINHKFLDIGAGSGYFSMCLYWKLYESLKDIIINNQERQEYIITNMIYMAEIQRENIEKLKELFGNNSNIIEGDFLNYNPNIEFDMIFGNPPYNSNGIKKVPSNKTANKKSDGITIWPKFIKHSTNILKKNGEIIVIIPAIWMKPDKFNTYDLITQYKIKKLMCFSNTETNKIFNKDCQTPTSIVYFKKSLNDFKVLIYDKDMKTYIDYSYGKNEPLPVFGASILSKIKSSNNIKNIIKTNCVKKNIKISSIQSKEFPYKNVKTCILNNLDPELVFEYSNEKLNYSDDKKIILAHKMYGFPYLDNKENLGISKRDNYLILSENENELSNYKDFFATKIALYLFECTRYRMKYLEKYIFELLPDVNKLNNFPTIINDETIAEYYDLTKMETDAINNLHKKKYTFRYV